MIFSLILSLIFSNQVHADPPTARLTQQDLQIQKDCRISVKSDGIDYNTCIAEAGRKAEEQRQIEARQVAAEAMRAMNQPQAPNQQELNVCKPSEALKACQESSQRAALMNNASTPKVELEEQMQNCLVSCNPSSSVVLREYLGGCTPSTKPFKEQMYLIMNNCGQGVAMGDDDKAPIEKPVDKAVSAVKEFFGYGDKPVPTIGDQWKMMSLNAGISTNVESSTSFANTQKIQLSQDVQYVKIEDRLGNEVVKYQSSDGTMHDSFETAAARSRQSVTVQNLPPLNDRVRNAEALRDEVGEDESLTSLATSPRPEARPTKPEVESPQVPTRTTAPQREGNEIQAQEDNYPRSNQPIYQQAGAPGAALQNALSSPVGGASSFSSPVSVGDVGEVSRGGSGSSSSGGGYGGGSGNSFKGSGRELSPVASNDVTPKPTSAAALDVADISAAATGQLSGGGFAGVGSGLEGRRMAAVSSGVSYDGGGLVMPSSDSFYKARGSDPLASRTRMVKADPNCRPTKTKPCLMKRISIAGKGSIGGAINCDGNPQCILKLTGKISASGALAMDSGSGDRSARGRGRGVASSAGAKRTTEFPVGVRRGGLEDIVQYMQNIGAAHMKLDHEGLLVTDH